MKEHLTLHRLRAILAILIAFALMLAPLNAAWAGMQMRSASEKVVTAAPSGDTAMSDCMKAMQAQGQDEPQDQNCPCCDTESKCPDMTTCLAKCSAQVSGILMPEARLAAVIGRHDRLADPQEPPDRSLRPPAPPPRS